MKVVILGAGNHAEVLIELAALLNIEIAGLTDEDAAATHIDGRPVLGGDAVLPDLKNRGISHFIVGFGGVRTNALRQQAFEKGIRAGLSPLTLIHPKAFVSPSADIGPGCQILASVLVHTKARLGSNVLVNSGSIIEHHAFIGDHSHVAPGAVLCGKSRLGDRAFVGAGATLIQGISLGADSIVAAGATVIADAPARSLLAGVPARPKEQPWPYGQ